MQWTRIAGLVLGGAMSAASLGVGPAQAAGIGVTGVRLAEVRTGPTLTLTATATLAGHSVSRGLDYQLWVQRATGQWVLADRFGPQASWVVPPGARAARAAVLPAALVRRKVWGLAVSSPVIPVTYPSLAAYVAHERQAPLALIQRDLHNPGALGTLNWSGRDGVYVMDTLGSPKASAAVHQQYATMFLYAMLANNASVYGGPANGGGTYPGDFSWNLQGGSPTNVAMVDRIKFLKFVEANGPTYLYRVVYTTTGGEIISLGFNVTLAGGSTPWQVLGCGVDPEA